MIDLHIHLLPGVDDGPEDRSEALEMCRRAAASCEALVATPHQRHHAWWNDDAALLGSLLRELQAALGPAPRLLLGAEIRVDSELLPALERRLSSGLLPLAGSRYLLLEFDRDGVGPDPHELVHELTVVGWRPILAHPEFIPALSADLESLRRLVAAGALVQVTAGSVTGLFGRTPRRLSWAMLDAGLVHFVASDAHGIDWRPPDLDAGRAAIAERWGEELAAELTERNPRAVVEDRPLVM